MNKDPEVTLKLDQVFVSHSHCGRLRVTCFDYER